MAFIHLHVHSHYSFKQSTIALDDLLAAAKAFDMSAVALTDYNNLCGAVRFYYAAREAGIKPLLGTETAAESGPVILLAMNEAGYSEICLLLTAVHLERGGICSFVDLARCKNLILLSACDALPQMLKYKEAFGDRFYVELQNHKTPGAGKKAAYLANLAALHGIKTVATNDVQYLKPAHYRVRDMLQAMGENRPLNSLRRKNMLNTEQYFKSPRAMQSLFRDFPEAVANTQEIGERCQVKLNEAFRFPVYNDLPKGHTARSYLRYLCREGVKKRYSVPAATQQRLDQELSVIDQMGFNDYFLAMWDIVNFARRRGIRCTGRGSAADSLVSYLLGITHVDPLRYNLLFERFLNPARKGMPDIDIDLDSNRRDEVINYVYERYGQDRVAMVCTVNTMGARSAVREVAKTLGFDRASQSVISKRLPWQLSADKIETARETLPELRGAFCDQPEIAKIFHYAARFADFPRHLGTHNGGVVIADDRISKYTPLQNAAKGVVICQHDKDDVEKLGLVKMDLLGLKMLSNITDAVAYLQNQGIALDIDHIPLDDEKVYALLRTTKTVGLFQVESPGQRELLGRLQPEEFEDIIAQISLFRPGPMQGEMIQPFIDRRHGRAPVDYMHPKLAPALRDTFGVLVYQEQVLMIANLLAGFTLGQADLLRRAMTKHRTAAEMETIRAQFMNGCLHNEVDEDTACRVFEKVAGFAAYGFNKAHAASFGWITYQSAYLKAHYPREFLCAMLNNFPCGFYPPQVLAWEAKRLGIPVYPPDVNYAGWDYAPEKDGLRVGLKQVAGMTRERWLILLTERLKHPFASAQEFRARTGLPEETIASLQRAGAFAGEFRPLKTRICGEMEALGLTISGHPLAVFPVKYQPSVAAEKLPDKAVVTVAGIIVSRQTPPLKSGKRIIFLTLQDPTGLIDVTVFPDVQTEFAKVVYESSLIRVRGTVRKTGRWYSVIAKEIAQIA